MDMDTSGRSPKQAAVQDSAGARVPSIAFAADGCIIALWQKLLIVVWATAGTGPLVAELARISDGLHNVYPKMSSIHIIVEGAGMPTEDARRGLSLLGSRFAERLACVATLIEAGGFWASAMRALVVSLQAVDRRPYKTRTFATRRELAAWVSPIHTAEVGEPCDAVELEAALAWVCAQPQARLNRA